MIRLKSVIPFVSFLLFSVATAFGALTATFNSPYDVGTSASSYTASGTLTVALNFSPTPGQQLLLVNNTGAGAISGTFTGLAEGATRTVAYGGNTFTFRISYVGGTGNDITLTRVAGAGQVTSSNTYLWSHLAGSAGGPGSQDATGSQASFNLPSGVAVDSAGNIYVADYSNHTIRKVTPVGGVTTLAGTAGTSGSTDGTGSAARFFNPSGVAVDSAGNIYVADSYNQTVRKVTPAGVVTTLAGSAGVPGSTDGTGSAARFNYPQGVAVDSAGNVFVADTNSNTIRKVTSAGVVTTLAGSSGLSGSTNGTGSAARFAGPWSVAVDSAGNVYVAEDYNDTIRKVTPAGVVTTLAGSAGLSGSTNGTGSAARFNSPWGVAVDGTGNVYVAEKNNHTIRKVTPAGVVSTLAGSAGLFGSIDGTGSTAQFDSPWGVAVDSTGTVYVADYSNHTIRKVTSAGVVTTLVGSASGYGSTDGTGSAARFYLPQGAAVDSTGTVYVADTANHTIRKVTPAGVVTTLAGTAGTSGSTDGIGSAALFGAPYGVAVDSSGNVYVADSGNHTIRKITSARVVTTLAGSAGYLGSTDGTGSAARFNCPWGVAVDSTGNVYVSDYYNNAIRKVTPAGVVTTLAGTAGTSGSTDGIGSAARFLAPRGVAVDGAGNVYVADSANQTIRKVTPAGVTTTLAGAVGNSGSIDGTGNAARFNFPWSMAVDGAGNVYVADSANQMIRKVTPAGFVTTLAGTAGVKGYNTGYGSARFDSPRGVAVSSSGRIYVSNTNFHRVVQGDVAGFHPILTQGNVSGLGVSAVTLNGTINPNGFMTTAAFEYGLTQSYGSNANVNLSTAAGTTAQNVTAGLTGLSSGTLYYYRLTATNVDGTAYTTGGTFKTLSTNADLNGLSLSNGTLSPAFASATAAYTASVDNTTTSITVTPTLAQADATLAVRINAGTYVVVASGSPSSALPLNVGSNTIDVRGTAQDGVTQKIYTVTVTRFAPPLNPTFNANSDVPVSSAGFVATSIPMGTLTLGFNPVPIQELFLVNNTGTGSVSGTFIGLAEGDTLTASYAGNSFTFRISYAGGDGNDITLTRVAGPGQVTSSNTYIWRHLAGSTGGPGSADAIGALASFNFPTDTAVDSAGNIYVADTWNHTIRKVTPTGVVTTLAGAAGISGSIDDTGSAARFYNPSGVAVDSSGNVYVADTYNLTIRKVTSAGVVTTLAGMAGVSGSTDGTGSAARFNQPEGVAVDSVGNVYVADTYNHTIRKITQAGVVTTLAGAGYSGYADGTGSAARFNQPSGVAVDTLGNVYVAEYYNHTIRKVTPTGVVTTLAGAGYSGYADGTGSAARFSYIQGVAVDGAGNVYVADASNYAIRKVTPAGVVTTLAGIAGAVGSADGTGSAARFNYPRGVAVDTSGNIFIADTNSNTIRKATQAGVVTTLAGTAGAYGSTDGTGSAARFSNPEGIAIDSVGNIYLAEYSNHTVRKVTPAGVVTTLAGTAGSSGSTDGTGSAARFNYPMGVAVDSAGNVYIADNSNHTIRKMSPTGVVTTFAGAAGISGKIDGMGSSARFCFPRGVAVDGTGSVCIADTNNHTIRKVTPTGVVTTLAGGFYGYGASGNADGVGAAALFCNPGGVAMDASGNVYVADSTNSTIRKVTPAGVVTTLAGTAGSIGSTDGTRQSARFNYPSAVALDTSGNVYVADHLNHTIRKVTSEGVVMTIGGLAGVMGNKVGTGNVARFQRPSGVAASADGLLYVTDGNNRVVQGELAGFQPILTQGNVSGLGVSAVTLNGTINPNGFMTTAAFEYGLTQSYESNANVNLSTAAGTTAQNVTAGLTGLSSGTLYYYRLTATNVDGTAYTTGGTFKTLSTNADLNGLSLSNGTLSPAFASATAAYTASVDNTTTSITVTPTLAQADATLAVRINAGTYAAVSSDSQTSALPLNVGTNIIDVRVTAQDGVTQKTYTVTVTLSPANNVGIAAWRQQYFGSDQNSGNSADLATPDGDGVPNLVKYALLMTPGTNGAPRMPLPAMAGPAGNRRLTLSFRRDPQRNDVTIVVEAQNTLGDTWVEIARSTNGGSFTGTASVSETADLNGEKIVTVEDAETNAPRRFMRLRIQR